MGFLIARNSSEPNKDQITLLKWDKQNLAACFGLLGSHHQTN